MCSNWEDHAARCGQKPVCRVQRRPQSPQSFATVMTGYLKTSWFISWEFVHARGPLAATARRIVPGAASEDCRVLGEGEVLNQVDDVHAEAVHALSSQAP